MKNSRSIRLGTGAVLVALAYAPTLQAQTYAPWLRQIGLTNTVASAANWGYGQLLGVVDTGINATHPEFASGQVAQSLSSCAAVNFKCASGFADDNGHGTAVASIAAGYRTSQFNVNYGGYSTAVGNFIGVAPRANIVAEKVLNAAGSGYSTDVANGIRKAADAGVGVINVSITYGNDASMVSAINYAASKGAFIVWAGGNSAQNLLSGANTSGLSAAAIQHLIFAGSVNASNGASSFTNKPGSGNLVDGTGKKTTYAQRWVMAPGEYILAPMTTAGNGAYSLWSGTSMAAPIVSGSLMLLQNAWPILKTNGTTANLLIATSSDLGSAGVDATYGNGLVNLTRAFQPYGSLMVTKANGQSVAVSTLSGSLISSGALGSLSAIQSKLAAYTAFDGYTRNFSINLSGLIKTPSTAATQNPLPTNAFGAPKVMKYGDGELAVSLQSAAEATSPSLLRDDTVATPLVGYALFTSADGTVSGLGYGSSSAYPFARALYNEDALAAAQSDFDLSSAARLAQNGYQLNYGVQLSPDLRVAASYSGSPGSQPGNPTAAQNTQYRLAAAYQLTPRLTGSLTLGRLDEQSSLLGASYQSGSILGLARNRSDLAGFTLAYRLSRDSTLSMNAEFGRTAAADAGSQSLFAGTTDIYSQAFGVSFLQRNWLRSNDQLLLSVRQPLRVNAGSAAIVTADVDSDGQPVYSRNWSTLSPDAREIDVNIGYRMPFGKRGTLALQGSVQRNALNIAGNNQVLAGVMLQTSF